MVSLAAHRAVALGRNQPPVRLAATGRGFCDYTVPDAEHRLRGKLERRRPSAQIMRYIASGLFSMVAALGLAWEFLSGQAGRPDDVRSGMTTARRWPASLFWMLAALPALAALVLLYALPALKTPRSSQAPVASAPSSEADACPTAADAGYGFTPDQPVAVGGGEFSGPLRASAYLQDLRGPQGEAVTFEPHGTVVEAGRTLHVFRITSVAVSAPRRLYVDYDRSAEVLIPLGLTCAAPLALPRA